MRLVGGKLRGRRLHAPEGTEVRPTSDRTREALFGILEGGRLSGGASPLPGARVLDAFAGTGAVGLEALSRGAASVTFLERYAPALTALRRNVAALAVTEHCQVLDRDALHPPQAEAPCRLVFLDPPYNLGLAAPAIAALDKRGWIDADSLVVVELMKTEDFAPPEGFELLDSRTYGKARLVFLRRQATEDSGDGD